MDKKLPRGKSHFKFKMNEWEDVSGLRRSKEGRKQKRKNMTKRWKEEMKKRKD